MRDMTMERPWVKLVSLSLSRLSPISISQAPLPLLSPLSTPISVLYILGDLSPVFNSPLPVRHNRPSIVTQTANQRLTNEKVALSGSATHSRGPFIQAAFIN